MVIKKILKTSAQAKAEQAKKDDRAECPECGRVCFPVLIEEPRGLRIDRYYFARCWNCGCEWESR